MSWAGPFRPTSDTIDISPGSISRVLSSLWSNTTGFWAAFWQVLFLSAALQVAVFAAPFQLQLVVDEAIFRADQELLSVLASGFGGLVIIQATVEALRGWTLRYFGALLSFQMVGNLVRHLLRLPADFFENDALATSSAPTECSFSKVENCACKKQSVLRWLAASSYQGRVEPIDLAGAGDDGARIRAGAITAPLAIALALGRAVISASSTACNTARTGSF